MRFCRSALWLLALSAVAFRPSVASTFVAMSQEDLVSKSTTVVEGEVLEAHSFWNDDSTSIYTDAQILVHDVILGFAPALVTVRVSGGTVGGVTLQAHGFPTFQKGERLVLFLEPRAGADEVFRVVGYQQGEYKIVPGPRGEDMVIPVATWSRARYVGTKATNTDLEPRSLSELRSSLRQLAAELGEKRSMQHEGGER